MLILQLHSTSNITRLIITPSSSPVRSMSQEGTSVDVASWLSQIESTLLSDTSPSITSKCKRKRSGYEDSSRNKHPRLRIRPVLTQLHHNTNTPRLRQTAMSPEKKQNGQVRTLSLEYSFTWFKTDRFKTLVGSVTPNTSSQQGSSKTRSSASLPKLAHNVHNVRRLLEDNGLYFQDKAYGDKFADFKRDIENIVFKRRESVMKPESVQKITNERVKNATTGELSYFRKLKPLVIKDERLVATKKRDFAEEVVYRSKAWADDGLDDKSDVPFVRGILFQDLQRSEAQLGLTNPKPDFTFGFEDPANPPRTAPRLSRADIALIKMAESLRHPFFVVENKSAQDPIEEAENQAIRSGAALVEARRQLENNARPADEIEKEGVDINSFAFSCCWVPQYANIFVHWYELRKDESLDNPFDEPTKKSVNGDGTLKQPDTYSSIWHMNLIQTYTFNREGDMKQFRSHLDNILEYGVSPERKGEIGVLELKLAAKQKALERALAA